VDALMESLSIRQYMTWVAFYEAEAYFNREAMKKGAKKR
jgi:hypothetical protein